MNETDPDRREILNDFIESETVTLRGYMREFALLASQYQPAPPRYVPTAPGAWAAPGTPGYQQQREERQYQQQGNREHLSRIGKIVQSLKKRHINKPDEVVLIRISKSESLLELGALGTDYAFSVYNNVKNMAGSDTKSFIGKFLGMGVNGSVSDEFPFLLSAEDATSFKMIKILRVADGVSSLDSRQQDVKYEIDACTFQHDAIVPMIHHRIEVDSEMSVKANCRSGVIDVLIMPWYITSLNKCPYGNFNHIAMQGMRIMSALEYIYGQGYVHLDVKATNIFVTSNKMWYLGDFGSCKPIGQPVTSSTFQFCYENIAFQPAKVTYDWFMFLLLVLIETLDDRRQYRSLFYLSPESQFADYNKVLEYATALVADPIIGELIGALLNKFV